MQSPGVRTRGESGRREEEEEEEEEAGGGGQGACCYIAAVSVGKQPLIPASPQALKQALLATTSQKSQGKEACGIYKSAE